jgi:LAGLIDADG endonuclease
MQVIGSENSDGADNQQESLSGKEQYFWFLAGLVEGEGSVHISLKKKSNARFGLYVQPEFFIYQHKSRLKLLEMAKEFFGTGRIRPKPGNPDVLVYSIISRAATAKVVVPFLERCTRFSARTEDYRCFIAVIRLLEAGLHNTPEGLVSIVEAAYSMNMGGKQRRTPIEEILDRILRGHTPHAL